MYNPSNPKSVRGSILAALLTLTLSTGAYAAGAHGGGHGAKPDAHGAKSDPHGGGHGDMHGSGTGEPGKASEISRVINMSMTDNLFTPETITVKKGETIRFVIKNEGEFVHEFNIGTAKMHAGHRKEMMMMVEHGILEPDRINHAKMKMDMGGGKTMEHNDPNSALVEPKKSAEIIWKFSESAKLEFACNVPGHYESGMVGKIQIH
ncbi:MAG: cupredoxin domain-containing protein [Rhodospirillales bacterium]|nr:cupredoxin domain-containing protein [Rhodospirillales bacterium]